MKFLSMEMSGIGGIKREYPYREVRYGRNKNGYVYNFIVIVCSVDRLADLALSNVATNIEFSLGFVH